MSRQPLIVTAVLCCLVLVLGACSPTTSTDNSTVVTAAAPDMPEHWEVTLDGLLPPDQIEVVALNLKADVSSVRNTIYNVDGKTVQINVIVCPDTSNADKAMATLRSMKAEQTFLRKDLVIYEFVGKNEVLPLISEGRKHIDQL